MTLLPYRLLALPTLLAAAVFALPNPARSQPAPPSQVTLTPEQIQRAGIQTAIANNAASTASDAGQHLSGTVVAPANAVSIVSTVVSGVVQKIHVQSLQQVQPGTPVATLFSQPLMEMQRDYLQLSIAAKLTQDKLARDESLLAEGIIARSRVQDSRGAAMQASIAAKERYQALRAAGLGESAIRKLASTQTLSPTLTVTAGARGTLQELSLKPGQRIEAGMPVASIVKDGPLWIEFQASRQQAALIRIGDPLQIKGCGPARVSAISAQVDSTNQSTLVRAEQNAGDGCLTLNQFVEATHQASSRGQAQGVSVPAAAVVRNGDGAFVFVRNAAGFEAVRVGVAPGVADPVRVTGKLQAGSPVAVKGLVALKGAWIGLGSGGAP